MKTKFEVKDRRGKVLETHILTVMGMRVKLAALLVEKHTRNEGGAVQVEMTEVRDKGKPPRVFRGYQYMRRDDGVWECEFPVPGGGREWRSYEKRKQWQKELADVLRAMKKGGQ